MAQIFDIFVNAFRGWIPSDRPHGAVHSKAPPKEVGQQSASEKVCSEGDFFCMAQNNTSSSWHTIWDSLPIFFLLFATGETEDEILFKTGRELEDEGDRLVKQGGFAEARVKFRQAAVIFKLFFDKIPKDAVADLDTEVTKDPFRLKVTEAFFLSKEFNALLGLAGGKPDAHLKKEMHEVYNRFSEAYKQVKELLSKLPPRLNLADIEAKFDIKWLDIAIHLYKGDLIWFDDKFLEAVYEYEKGIETFGDDEKRLGSKVIAFESLKAALYSEIDRVEGDAYGLLRKVVDVSEELYEISRLKGDARGMVISLLNRANALRRIGLRLGDAVSDLEEALEKARGIADGELKMLVSGEMVKTYMMMRETDFIDGEKGLIEAYKKGADFSEESAVLCEKLGEFSKAATAYFNAGILLVEAITRSESFESALAGQAIRVFRKATEFFDIVNMDQDVSLSKGMEGVLVNYISDKNAAALWETLKEVYGMGFTNDVAILIETANKNSWSLSDFLWRLTDMDQNLTEIFVNSLFPWRGVKIDYSKLPGRTGWPDLVIRFLERQFGYLHGVDKEGNTMDISMLLGNVVKIEGSHASDPELRKYLGIGNVSVSKKFKKVEDTVEKVRNVERGIKEKGKNK